jgi:hypothetical protein
MKLADGPKLNEQDPYQAPRPAYAVAIAVCTRRTIWSLWGVDILLAVLLFRMLLRVKSELVEAWA